jgi:hypothetical protein
MQHFEDVLKNVPETRTYVSVHVNRPERLQRRLDDSFPAALHEYTKVKSSAYGATFLGVHTPNDTRFFAFGPSDRSQSPNKQSSKRDLAAIGLVPGQILVWQDVRADDHGVFLVSREAYSNVLNYVGNAMRQPLQFHSLWNNCAKFVVQALEVARVELVTAGIAPVFAKMRRPQDISEVLQRQPQRENANFFIDQPLLLQPGVLETLGIHTNVPMNSVRSAHGRPDFASLQPYDSYGV